MAANQRDVPEEYAIVISDATSATSRTPTRNPNLVIGGIPGASGLRSTPNEAITDSHDRLNAIAARVQFLTQPANVHVERSRLTVITVPPNLIQQLLPRNHPSRTLPQHSEQGEFLVGQLDLRLVSDDAYC